jgi:hypothetical protein
MTPQYNDLRREHDRCSAHGRLRRRQYQDVDGISISFTSRMPPPS